MKGEAHVAAGRASPGMRYKDVDAAIAFLCSAFGFELRSAETGPDGRTIYAELSFGSTIIMIGAVSGFDMDRFMAQPGDIGGAETQCCYYVVEDIDAQYARARNAGCRIVIDMQTRRNGARAFTCRDHEGHLWCFGTYDPWASLAIAPDRSLPVAEAPPAHKFPARLAAGLSMAALVSTLGAAWIYGEAWQSAREAGAAPVGVTGPERVISIELSKETFQSAIKDARRRLAVERRIRRAAERASEAAQAAATEERRQRLAAEATAEDLAEQLAGAQEAASAAQAQLAQEHGRQRGSLGDREQLARALDAAQRAAADARAALEHARIAKAAAEKEAQETRARLTFVSHNARQSSEQAIADLRRQMHGEKAARVAAEREAETARDALARERQLKQAAYETVEQLERRLAATGGQTVSKKARLKKAVAARKKSKAKAASQAMGASPAPTQTAEKGWSLYSGPVFAKDPGQPPP